MKKLTISISDRMSCFMYYILEQFDDLLLILDINDNLKDIKTKEKIEKNVVDFLECIEKTEDGHDKEKEILKKHVNKEINIFDGIDYICFNGEISDIKQFLSNNEQLKKEKIVLDMGEIYDILRLKEIINQFKGWDNIYISVSFLEEPVKLEKYITGAVCINKFMIDVVRLNLSPLEEMMMIYSFIITKKVMLEDSTIRGNEVICDNLSFKEICKLYEDLLQKFGYKYKVCYGTIDNKYHMKICYLIYINDPKYGVNGLYYFSPLLDTLLNDIESKKSFKYFARTVSSFENDDFNIKLDEQLNNNLIDQLLYSISTEGIIGLDNKIYKGINRISDLILEKNIIPSYCRNKELYELLPDELKSDLNLKQIIKEIINFRDKIDTPIEQGILLYLLDNLLDIYDKISGTETDYLSFLEIALNSGWDIFETGEIERKKVFYKQYIEKIFEDNLDEDSEE